MSEIKVLTWQDIAFRLQELFIDEYEADEGPDPYPPPRVYGVPKGGMIAASFLGAHTSSQIVFAPEEASVILDDVIDSGATMEIYKRRFPSTSFIALYDKRPGIGNSDPNVFLEFPWETDHPGGAQDSVQQNIVRLLQYIGEDASREGLLETPNRIIRSYGELFSGYQRNPEDLLTVFASDGYDQIVLLKDIELYSMCEHHMLPFYGKAHVAYIPKKKVIGISKLARLVDVYARRLQIQERIGEEVTGALMRHLQPAGAACVIEATHMCMRMRGVSKQNSTMITSSLKGAFLENTAAREELMGLIR